MVSLADDCRCLLESRLWHQSGSRYYSPPQSEPGAMKRVKQNIVKPGQVSAVCLKVDSLDFT